MDAAPPSRPSRELFSSSLDGGDECVRLRFRTGSDENWAREVLGCENCVVDDGARGRAKSGIVLVVLG